MEDRFWVGGTGTWNASSTTHWSTSSGGSSGASVPGSSDTVIFDGSSGGGTVTLDGITSTIAALNMGAAATMTFAGTGNIEVSGNITFGANVTWTATTSVKSFGTCSLTSNGMTLAGEFWIGSGGGSAGTVTLADAFTVNSSGTVRLNEGTFDANNFAFSTGNFVSSPVASTTRVLTLGSAAHSLTGGNSSFSITNTTNLTINKGTGSINLSRSGTQIFDAGGLEINNLKATNSGSRFIQGSSIINNLDFTGFTGTWESGTFTCKGDLTLVSGMTVASGSGTVTLGGASGTQTITSAGKTIDRPVTIDASGATKQLADALTMGSTRTLTLTAGSFDANDQTVTLGRFSSSNSNTRTISMGSGLWTLTGTGTVWTLSTTSGLTFNKETANIKITDTSANQCTFAGGSLTYNDVWFARGTSTGTNTITGTPTFDDFKDDGTIAHQETWPAGATCTFTTFTVSGNPSQLISLRSSSAGSQATLSCASGTINCDYLNIKDSNAIGGATWNAGDNSIDNGNNDGWIFLVVPVTQAYGIIIF